MTWTYYPDTNRYRDDDTGRFATKKDVWRWSDANILAYAEQSRNLATGLAEGRSVGVWENEMRAHIKAEYVRQYLLGRGGRDAMTQADWGSVGGMIAEQYKHLDGFAAEIAAGELSEKMIAARSEMYILSAREAFNRAGAHARGITSDDLPAFPGDGSSCLGLTRCGCNWDYQKRGNTWECYWLLNTGKANCELCIQHASEWAPFTIEMATKAGRFVTIEGRLVFMGGPGQGTGRANQ